MRRGKLIPGIAALAFWLAGAVPAQNNTVIIQDPNAPEGKASPKDTVILRDTSFSKVVPDTARNPADDTVGGIQSGEERTLERRRKAKNFTGAGLGPVAFGHLEENKPSYNFYLAHFWEVNSRAAIKAVGEVASDLDHAHYFDFSGGVNFYAMPTDFSPYLGGNFGLGFDQSRGNDAFGFNVGASLGALMFRTSTAQVNLEAMAQMLLDKSDEVGPDEDDEFPTIIGARVGVLF
jgi:hypothetical protein